MVLVILSFSLCQTQIEESACSSYYPKIYLMSSTVQRINLRFLLSKDLPYVKHRLRNQLVVLIIQRSTLCQTLSKESACGSCYSKPYLILNTIQRLLSWGFLLSNDLPYVKHNLNNQLVVLVIQRPTLCQTLSKESDYGSCYPKI